MGVVRAAKRAGILRLGDHDLALFAGHNAGGIDRGGGAECILSCHVDLISEIFVV